MDASITFADFPLGGLPLFTTFVHSQIPMEPQNDTHIAVLLAGVQKHPDRDSQMRTNVSCHGQARKQSPCRGTYDWPSSV